MSGFRVEGLVVWGFGLWVSFQLGIMENQMEKKMTGNWLYIRAHPKSWTLYPKPERIVGFGEAPGLLYPGREGGAGERAGAVSDTMKPLDTPDFGIP